MRKQVRYFWFAMGLFFSLLMAGSAVASPPYNIAIVQHQHFLPFQQALDAFVFNLGVLGKYSDYRIVDSYNAQGDLGALESKVSELAGRSDLDLIFTIGTHSTIRMINAEKHTPILYTLVGDPQNAGIVTDWKSSGANYTGIETPEYYSKVVRLIYRFVSFKSLGMIYLEGSPSHEAGLRQIRKLSKDLGFNFVSIGFPLRDENGVRLPRDQIRNNIQSSLKAVCPKVEVFFVQTSNTFTKEFDVFMAAFTKYQIISAGDPINIEKGLVMGIGKDAKRFGRQCAQYAIKILQGTLPAELRMDAGGKLSVDVNLKAAGMVGFEVPIELISCVDNLYQDIFTDGIAPETQKSGYDEKKHRTQTDS